MYTPQIGDRVAATRKMKSKIYANTIVGPVSHVYDNACRIKTNGGKATETDWQINYSDWDLELIYPVPLVDKNGNWDKKGNI